MSTILFWCIRSSILTAKKPLNAGLLALPLIYGLTTGINVISIVLDGPKMLYMDNIGAGLAVIISLSIGLIIAIIVQLFVVPWQRRKITGNDESSGPVKFTINGSSESTPSGSPKKNRRPTSLVQNDLPAITEQTELASFNNLGALSPCFYQNGAKIGDKRNGMANGSYKIDPKIIAKAEILLNKNRSLDNTDLTITSLNFIDEHQQQNGYIHARTDCQTLQSYFNPISSNLNQTYVFKDF